MTTPWNNHSEEAVTVTVSPGSSTRQILASLETSGVLRDQAVPLLYLKAIHPGDSLKAGTYLFEGENTPLEVIDKLIEGRTWLGSVTVREGLDRFEIAKVMSEAGFGSEDDWNEKTSDPARIRDLSPEASSLEGYLFPDTYKFTPGTSVDRIIDKMVDTFRDRFAEQMAYIETDLSLHETVTLASIVELEAQLSEEREPIAGVYYNRIRKGMLLQADPTVIYALKLAGEWDGNIRKADLSMASPYNTYKTREIPPGPIGNPGLASLTAAARPATHDYYYFVSRNDGSHVFSSNLAEHNRNVEEFQRQYWRDQRRLEQANGDKPESTVKTSSEPSKK